jgi:hypothetical protein
MARRDYHYSDGSYDEEGEREDRLASDDMAQRMLDILNGQLTQQVVSAVARVVQEMARNYRDGDIINFAPSSFSEAPEVSRDHVKGVLIRIAREALDHGEPDELGGWSLLFSQAAKEEEDARELANRRATRPRRPR